MTAVAANPPNPNLLGVGPMPARSQSFRHRRQTQPKDGDKSPLAGGSVSPRPGQHRRKSTPNVQRQASGRNVNAANRLDVWPTAQHSSSQRLLPPDTGEDYKRLRQFEVDRKGCLINRGDSFRRRTGSTSTAQASESRSGSIGSQGSTSGMVCPPDNVFTDNDNNDGVVSYDVYVMGDTACGKSSLIRQSMTSEHRNPFMNDDEQSSNEMSVSVSIDGEVTEFIFFEGGTEEDQLTMTRLASAYILMYSVNSRSSFRHATQLLQNLRESAHTSTRPVILCGNKCDLARKRVITSSEATSLAKDNNCVAYEVSLALNHGVDELLVALLTEIKQSKQQRHACGLHPSDKDTNDNKNMLGITKSLRRFSRRHRKQGHQPAKKTESAKLNGSQELAAHSYTNLVGRFTKYWKGTHARSCQDLQSSP